MPDPCTCAILAGMVPAGSVAPPRLNLEERTPSSGGPELGAERTQRWKVGMTVVAQTPCLDIFGTVPVPTNWPEQDVKVIDEQISDSIPQVRYRDLEGGIRQMLVAVPQLAAGEKAEALVTFEVMRRAIGLPIDTSVYRLPKKVPRDARKYLANSPLIDCRNRKIRDLAKEITADKEGAWQKVEAIHNWVKENVKHTNDKAKVRDKTLHDKRGHMEDLTGLFIALCRAEKIPAADRLGSRLLLCRVLSRGCRRQWSLVSLRAERENGVRHRVERRHDSAEGRQHRGARKERTTTIRRGVRQRQRATAGVVYAASRTNESPGCYPVS